MTRHSTIASIVLRGMLDWGLNDLLTTLERRSLRAVCRELRYSMKGLLDTLVVYVDNAALYPRNKVARAIEMAVYHRKHREAHQLHVRFYYCEFFKNDAAKDFMHTYAQEILRVRPGSATVTAGLPAVKRCWVSVAEGCQLQLAPFTQLISLLPALEELTIHTEDMQAASGSVAPAVLSTLASCKCLHTLAIDGGLCKLPPGACEDAIVKDSTIQAVMNALSQLTQLRSLSLGFAVRCRELAPLISLSQLGCLQIQALTGPRWRVQLPSVRILNAAVDTAISSASDMDDTCQSSKPIGWSPHMSQLVTVHVLPAFPALEHMTGIKISVPDKSTLVYVPRAVKRFSSSAEHWAMSVDVSKLSSPAILRLVQWGG